MNSETNSGNFDPRQDQLDKTFVEGSKLPPVFSELQPGTRINATSFRPINPYTQVGSTQIGRTQSMVGADGLPSGKEPIQLGSGTIAGLLGTGGMAKVYKIWNEKLEVFRAVKILFPTQQADLKNRFETEAKITAKLHHPNIVEIYSVGDWNSLPYLEMEYIDGSSLESFIHKNEKLPAIVCNAIAMLVARALEYAHCQEFLIYGKNYHGVIHRDLKPANIMISSNGDVRLMDFGIARPTEASLHTVDGNIVGTMQYLSPEQLDGVDIDCRTDIYSFGAILYEMLTGTKTFPQDTITNLMKKKITNEYRKFSDFDFSVSHSLARIAQKCLQINKTDRYSSMSELLSNLDTSYRTLSSDPPGKILKKYVTDPASIVDSSKKSFRIKLPNKILIPVLSAMVLGALVTVFLKTGPNSTSEEKPTTLKPPVNATPALVAPSLPPAVAAPQKPEIVQAEPVEAKQPTKPLPSTPQKPKHSFPKTDPVALQPDVKQAPSLSPIDALKEKYSSADFFTIGKSALAAGATRDAITALEQVPDNHPEASAKTIYLFEAYIESGRNKDALYIANSENLNDAQYDYLCGLLYEKMGKNTEAFEALQRSLTKPSTIRNRSAIRNDALYHTALLWSSEHTKNPTAESRIQTLNAWNTVKRLYLNQPESTRFVKANRELATIQ